MKLRVRQLFGYAAGDAANNLAFAMSSMFLLVYYTDVAGIPAAAAGTIFLVVRIWDGFADLAAGRLVDKTRTRFGKFRPWLLYASVPLLLLSVAAFAVPDWPVPAKIGYAYLTYAAMGTAYSLVNIPYGSLAAAMTQDPVERTKLAGARGMGAAATMLMLSFAVSPQIRNSENLQRSLLLTTLAFVVVGAGLYLFTFATARETVPRAVTKVGLKDSLRTLRRNKPLVMLSVSSLFFLTAMASIQTVGVYYARDVLGDPGFYIAISAPQLVLMFVLAPFVPKLVRRFGKVASYVSGGVMMVAGGVGVLLAPAAVPFLSLGFFLLIGAGLGLVNTLMWSLEADTVDYGEWKTGARTEGTTYAVFSFVRKIGQALGGAAAAYTMAIAGYAGGARVQSEGALWGIRAAAGLVPAACTVIAVVIMISYPLTEKRLREITAEVARRRHQLVES